MLRAGLEGTAETDLQKTLRPADYVTTTVTAGLEEVYLVVDDTREDRAR